MQALRNTITTIFTPQIRLITLATLFIMLTGNITLFGKLLQAYPPNLQHLPMLASLFAFFSLGTLLFFLIISHGRATRWILAIFLVISATTAYYMDSFGAIIDADMLQNMAETDTQEALGLMNGSMLLRVMLLGALPAWWVVRQKPVTTDWLQELRARGLLIGLVVLALVVVVLPLWSSYIFYISQHKFTRTYANPLYPIYSTLKFFKHPLEARAYGQLQMQPTAQDAVFLDNHSKHELIIMVVGETARFDRFSLNGYSKETNPLLAKEQVVSFKNVHSCGTSTSVSVPCMFSVLSRKAFNHDKALHMENALDVLTDNGVAVLWRDNNSDSKGVALRIQYENFKTPTLNQMCDTECRDVGMLNGLDQYIENHQNQDIMIVLHQMGNHGPRYSKRYPKAFERFKPVCEKGELNECTQEEVDNAYDNAILYTDYFLAQTIQFLKQYDEQYETAMLYVSDHGESLGENGVYLHAAPYEIAPKEQTHVPSVLWLGQHFDYKLAQIQPYENHPLSHDDVFCTILTAFELKSHTCDAKAGWLIENLDIQATLKTSPNINRSNGNYLAR
jgi:lipid A ethanolaminephosphotransferase